VVSKNPHISNLMKIHPVGAESFHENRWMDRQFTFSILWMCLKIDILERKQKLLQEFH